MMTTNHEEYEVEEDAYCGLIQDLAAKDKEPTIEVPEDALTSLEAWNAWLDGLREK